MRLSWLAQLFTRGRTRAAADVAAAPAGRFRADPTGARGQPVPIVPSRSRHRSEADAAFSARSPLVPSVMPGDMPGSMDGSGTGAAADASAEAPSAAATQARSDEIGKDERSEMIRATKMAPQEELAIKMNEGLKSLSTLLSAIDEKLAQQHRATEVVADRLQTLPRVLEGLVAAERTSLETLRDLRTSLDQQGKAALHASEELGKLPSLVDTIGTRIERQTEAASSMRTSVESVGQSVRGLVDVSQRASNSLITEFRRGQDEQRDRLAQMVERQRRTMWIVAGIGAVVVVCLLIVLTRLPR